MLDWSNLGTLAIAAVLTAGLYATMSFGLALVYGVMKIINLAHAATMMLAAFTVLTLNRSFGLDPIIGSIVILPLFFAAGMTLYHFAVRRVAAVPIASLLLLFGIWLVAQNAAYLIWGSEDQSIVTAYTYSTVDLFGFQVAVTRIVPFVMSLVMLGVMRWFLGVALGALVLATIESFSILIPGWRASLVNLLAFGLLVIALVVLPGGIASLIARRTGRAVQ